jgi:hypothetical protein
MVHLLNAPSPAATASMGIGRTIAEYALESFGATTNGANGAAKPAAVTQPA